MYIVRASPFLCEKQRGKGKPLHPETPQSGFKKSHDGEALMAIYHLNLSSGSRGGGQSAAAKADYIEREGKYAKGKKEIAYIAHGNMPDFAKDNPREYWQSADNFERENGRLFQQIEFALPRELSQEAQIALAREFVSAVCDEHQLPYSFAIHKGEYNHQGKRVSKEAKPHVHLIFSERRNDGIRRSAEQWFKRANKKEPSKGGALKVREIKATEWLELQRKTWEKLANESLEKAGHQERIDHRSLEAQGIKDRLPQPKKGKAIYIEQRGIQSESIAHFAEVMRDSEQLQTLQNTTLKLKEKIEQLKTAILRLARQHFTPKHTSEMRSLDTLKSPANHQTMNSINTIATVKTLYEEKSNEQRKNSDYLQGLPKQRDDNRNHFERGFTNQNNQHLLRSNARHDVETVRATPHSPVQPLRENTNNHRGRTEQRVAILISQYSYSLLEMHTQAKIEQLKKAQSHRKFLQDKQQKIQENLQALEQKQMADTRTLEQLQNLGFLKRRQNKEQIEAIQKRLQIQHRDLITQREVLNELPSQLAQAIAHEQQCDTTLSVYALAVRISGQQERLKQLPPHLHHQWQQIETQTYQRNREDIDILRAERSLKAQFLTLQKGGITQHRTSEHHR